jgi:hypothetical protein
MATRRKLGAKWQLDAALLSRPVDLTTLVSMSLSDPQEFFKDDTLHRMVKLLLNEGNERRSNHHTKLDVLGILSNLARDPSQSVKDEIKMILQGVSEWFDEYLQSEPVGGVDADGVPIEPEMHKTMLLVLSRTYDYALRTEDLLELSGGDRQTALVTVVALLEDGETYTTALTQRQMAGEGRVAQWERKLVCIRYERPMLLQLCRLLRGFTHPGSYFRHQIPPSSSSSLADAVGADGGSNELTLFSVDQFSDEINALLSLTLSSGLLEKLTLALHGCLFASEDAEEDEGDLLDSEGDLDNEARSGHWGGGGLVALAGGALGTHRLLDQHEHFALASVNGFLHNIYLYGTKGTAEYQQHLLSDTTLITRLLMPYLELCVVEARLLSDRQAAEDLVHARNGSESGGSRECRGKESWHGPMVDIEYSLGVHPQTNSIQGGGGGKPGEQQVKVGGVSSGSNLRRQSLALASGISASLRTLVIASFRVPPTRHMLHLLLQLNPTASLLRASAFVAQHPELFGLLCLLNINMNALDVTQRGGRAVARRRRRGRMQSLRRHHQHRVAGGSGENDESDPDTAYRQGGCGDDYGDALDGSNLNDEHNNDDDGDGDDDFEGSGGMTEMVQAYHAHSLLHDVALVHMEMPRRAQLKVLQVVLSSGGLPVSRDTPSYAAVVSVLQAALSPNGSGGRGAGVADDETDAKEGVRSKEVTELTGGALGGEGDDEEEVVGRESVKSAATARLKQLSSRVGEALAEAKGGATVEMAALEAPSSLDPMFGTAAAAGVSSLLRAESKANFASSPSLDSMGSREHRRCDTDSTEAGGDFKRAMGGRGAKEVVDSLGGGLRLLGDLPSLGGGGRGGEWGAHAILKMQLELPGGQQERREQLVEQLGEAAARLDEGQQQELRRRPPRRRGESNYLSQRRSSGEGEPFSGHYDGRSGRNDGGYTYHRYRG